VFSELRKDWRVIRNNPPGERFQARYRRRRKDLPVFHPWRIIRVIAGVLLIPLGMVLWFIPGPGWLTIFLGLALLAVESRQLSAFLDWTEVRIRRVFRRLRSSGPYK